MLHVHPTAYRYTGDASPSTPGGMAIIYKDLIASDERTRQVIADITVALAEGRNCLVLTNWTGHLDTIAGALRALGHDPVSLKGGMGAKDRAAALARLTPQPGGAPLLAVATGPYAGEGFDCPPLDTLFLAAPVASKGRLLQYAGRILRPHDGKATAEVHDYHDELTGVLASSLAKRAPGYTSLGFPNPRKLPYTPSASTVRSAQSQRTRNMKQIAARLTGLLSGPTYEVGDTVAIGDLVRVPGSGSGFIKDGETGTAIALDSPLHQPCKRVTGVT